MMANFGGTTLGNCQVHCDSISSDELLVCIEVKKVLPDRHLIHIEPDAPTCLNVSPSEQQFYLEAYEYGRKQFIITNSRGCSNTEEPVEFIVKWTSTPTSDTDPNNMTETRWTLSSLLNH